MIDSHIIKQKPNNDECYTPRYGVEPLLEFLDLFVIRKFAPVESKIPTSQSFSSATCLPCPSTSQPVASLRQKLIIWTPFDDENSEFVKVFTESGYKVIHSHISEGKDFFTYEPEEWDVMISNPPFTNKSNIFKRALSFNKPFALLMKITWLNDGTPANVFRDRELQILSFNERMTFRNQPQGKISFLSAYFCYNFLPKNFLFRTFRNRGQQNLFKENIYEE